MVSPNCLEKTLAQLLRTLGEYLDAKEATTFHISCAPDSMSVDYQIPAGISERKDLPSRDFINSLCIRDSGGCSPTHSPYNPLLVLF